MIYSEILKSNGIKHFNELDTTELLFIIRHIVPMVNLQSFNV